MKKIIYSVLSLIILIIINIISAKLINVEFLEMSFATGLISSVVIAFFSSEGGLISNAVDMKVKHFLESETRKNSYFTKFHMNIPLKVAICYTVISIVLSVIAYWKYF
ncbi:hypothetical protein CHL78_010720 [Romboutsia weinsteinii]|uniref:DUF3899 domain-containing protein n=1 Tax=Romboutsia weinsteinii TaxID=2020949 RepID=A0A371J331_9FIRM|nr:hypothetical protein [Romboutsia weinsteinii]RDY27087.1 hypothetical protein CHL78_010720 [Romboutsia weinsteinii]